MCNVYIEITVAHCYIKCNLKENIEINRNKKNPHKIQTKSIDKQQHPIKNIVISTSAINYMNQIQLKKFKFYAIYMYNGRE